MSPGKLRILLIDDDEEEYLFVHGLLAALHSRPSFYTYEVEWVGTFDDALASLRLKQHDVYLIDYRLGSRTGLELLVEASPQSISVPVIILTGHGSYDIDLEAMRVGATDYLSKNELTPALLERSMRYAIESKRAEEEARRTAARSAQLALLSHSIAEAGLSYPELTGEIAQKISTAVEAPCFIFLKSDLTFSLRHSDPQVCQSANEFLQEVQSLASTDLLSAQKLQIHNHVPRLVSTTVALSPGQESVLKKFNSLITVPLSVRENFLGTLGILRSSHSDLSSEDVNFFTSLADRAALAIENARLYGSAQQRALELDALHKATSALLSTLDLDELLAQILDAAQSAFPAAEKGLLYLIAPGTTELKVRAISGFKDPRIKKIAFPKGTDYPARVLQEKKPVLIEDMAKISPNTESLPFRSAILVPLYHSFSVHGVITLSSSYAAAFTPRDLHLFESFAATATAVLQNALLHAEVQKLAITDSLTGYLNRRGFDDLGAREMERAVRFERPLSIVMVDIDNFKEINDTYGHAVGDRVLHNLAQRLLASLREVDIVGRYGGDEFVILLPEANVDIAIAVAERLRTALHKPLFVGKPLLPENPLTVSASFGVAELTKESQDIAALIEKADAAAYRAKQKGRNLVEVA